MSCMGRGIVLRQIDRLFREGTLSGLGDGQLLERYRTRRDEAAFEALVDLHGPMVLGLCRRMLRDPRDIEDAFQATFLVLVRKAPAIRDGNLLSNWLYGVAYRVARRARTQTLRRRGHEAAVAALELAARPESSEGPEIDPVLDQELNRLPERYRAPLILCYLRGRTHDQAAEELRCPVGTVRSRLARGRDLLKKRLTRRGFAPTAATLGTGPGLPAKLLVEAVPPSLVSATMKAAFGFGSAQTIQAGAIAASALALAQGVLTTMKLAQLKWIGLAVLATTLSAGGVVAVSSAAPQNARSTGAAAALDVTEPGPQEPTASHQPGSPRVEQRLKELERRFELLAKMYAAQQQYRTANQPDFQRVLDEIANRTGANPTPSPHEERRTPPPIGQTTMAHLSAERFDALEQKVDQLLKRLGTNPPATPATTSPFTTQGGIADPFAGDQPRPTRSPDRPDDGLPETLPAISHTIRELEIQLKRQLEDYDDNNPEMTYRSDVPGRMAWEESRKQVRATTSLLEGLDQDIADEIARLKLEMRRKNAERLKAEAQTEVAQTVVARNKRLNERKPGMVSSEDVARGEGEYKVATAQIQIVEAEIAEVGLRIQQLQSRQNRIKQVIALADRAKAAAPAK